MGDLSFPEERRRMENNSASPLVSIISVNYNHSDVTCEMLASLRKVTYPNLEIIVVDNGSPDDTPGIIKERFPEVTLLTSEVNLGFAGANNLGVEASRGDYIMFLNNDTEVTPGFLEPLVSKMQSDPKIGAVSPKIRFHYAPDIIQYAGMTHINTITSRNRAIGFRETDKGQYEQDRITAYAHGAAMMTSRRVIRTIGLMSTTFFLYYEELDWCFRLRKAGYLICYVHDSLILHKESISTGKMSPLKTYYLNRSRLLYFRRNATRLQLFTGIFFQVFFSIPKNILSFLVHGNTDLLRAYLRAVGWHIRHSFSREIYGHPILTR
jgi:GT2 family glycosyltransferase